MSQYVCVRINRMDDVDIGLFERDWNNTLYFFIMNADEQIYMRYGGRDTRGPMTYLDLNSLELALEKGLDLHRDYLAGKLEKTERPKPMYPREIPPLVERTFARGQCVECHLIGDYSLVHKEETGALDKIKDMYRWPEIRHIGIELDVPRGLVVKEARGAVAAAGMQPGDRIAALNDTPVWTYADLQHRYDKVPRDARQVRVSVQRGAQSFDLTVNLPERWWMSDLRFRKLTIDPRAEFDTRPLTEAEKGKLGLRSGGFAGEVTGIGGFAEMLKVHELKAGDIVYAVDGIEADAVANTPELYIKLRKKAGDTVMLSVIRNGTRLKLPVHTQRMAFRKS
jgi:hypothetical protein